MKITKNYLTAEDSFDDLFLSIVEHISPLIIHDILTDLVSDIDEGKYFDLADLRDYTQSWLLNHPIHEDLNSPSTNNKSVGLDVKTDNKVNLKKYIVPKNNKIKTTKNNKS